MLTLTSLCYNNRATLGTTTAVRVQLRKVTMLLVFGGGSGIGLAIARQMSAQGHPVTMLGRDEDKLVNASSQISAQWRVCDARDFAQV